MTRNETKLFVDLENTGRILDDAVLVAAFDVFHIVAAVNEGEPAIDRLRLQAGIADCLVGLGMAHHRGQDEERVLPFALIDALAFPVEDTPVVGVHERVGPALQFIVNSRRRFEVIGAGSATRNELGLQSRCLQARDGFLHLGNGSIQLGLAWSAP